jgi:hypothetical protein
VTAPDGLPLAFVGDEASDQLLSDAYRLKGLLQQRELPLADDAADAARHGSFDSSSPWVKAFESVRHSVQCGSVVLCRRVPWAV